METLFRARRRTPEVEPVSDIWDDGLVAAAPLPQEEFQPTLNGKQVSFFKQVLDMPAPEEGPAPGTYFANKAKSRSSKSKKEEVPASPPAAKPVASDNVYVQYLPPDCGDEELFNLFSQVGEVKSCRVIMDFEKNRSKGYGFVLFARPEDAQRSVESYNGLPYNGKRLMVRLADHSPSATSNQSNATATASPADVVEVSTKSASSKQHWRETELKQHFGVYGLQSIRSARILVDDAPAAVANVPTQAVAATQNEPKPSTTFVETDRQSQAHAVSASTFGFRQRDNNRTGIESTAHAFGPSCWCGGSRCVEDLGLKLNRHDSTPMAEAPSSYPSAQELYEQFQVTPGSRNVRLPGLAPCAPGAVLCRPPTHLVNTAAAAGIQFYRHDPYMMGNSYTPAMDRTGSGSSHQRRTWAPTV